MKYELLYTLRARKDLMALDKKIGSRIMDKMDFFVDSGEPLNYAKKLAYGELGTHGFRVGDYRIIFDIDNKGNMTILLILRIRHRKDVYL